MKKFTLVFCFAILFVMSSLASSSDSLYWENFTNTANDNKGCWGSGAAAAPVIDTTGVTDWFIDTHGASGFISPTADYFKQVTADKFAAQDVLKGNPYVSWLSRVTDISSVEKAKIKANFEFKGTGFTSAYFLKAYYVLDGGSDTIEFKSVTGDQIISNPEAFVAEIDKLSGNTLQVIIRVATAGTRFINILDVLIAEDPPVVVEATSVSLDQSALTIKMYSAAQLTANILPAEATNKELAWQSLDENIAIIDNGEVIAKAIGSTKVVVTALGGTDVTDTCDITIIPSDTLYLEVFTNTANDNKGCWGSGSAAPPVIDTTGVTDWFIDIHGATGFISATKDHFIQVTSDKFSAQDVLKGNPYVSWLSKVTDISSVDKAKIKVNFEFVGSGFTTSYFLKAYYVLDGSSDTVEFKSVTGDQITLSPEALAAEVGQLSGNTLQVIIRVATAGTRYINILDVMISKDDTPSVDVTSVTLDQSELTIKTDNSAQLSASILPEEATNKLLSWQSLDETVAIVEGGVVTAMAIGTTKVIVTALGGTDIADTCNIIVVQNDTVYIEDFSKTANNDKGVKGDGTVGTYDLVYNQPADGSWTIDADGAEMELTTDYFIQHGGSQSLLARNINGNPDAKWTSREIDISMFEKVKISLDLIFACQYDETEYAEAYYTVDGSNEAVLIGSVPGKGAVGSTDYQPNDTTLAVNWVVGSTLHVIIRCNNNASTDYTKFDNIIVAEDTSTPPVSINNSVYNNSAEMFAFRNQLKVRTSEPQSLNIYSLSGVLVKSQKINIGETYVSLPTGFYIATLRSNSGIISNKIFIQ